MDRCWKFPKYNDIVEPKFVFYGTVHQATSSLKLDIIRQSHTSVLSLNYQGFISYFVLRQGFIMYNF